MSALLWWFASKGKSGHTWHQISILKLIWTWYVYILYPSWTTGVDSPVSTLWTSTWAFTFTWACLGTSFPKTTQNIPITSTIQLVFLPSCGLDSVNFYSSNTFTMACLVFLKFQINEMCYKMQMNLINKGCPKSRILQGETGKVDHIHILIKFISLKV